MPRQPSERSQTSVPEGDAVDERRRIVDAAWAVLERSGFQGLKVGSVVRAVPTSTRAFYQWFDDKDHLVLELMCEELQRAGSRIGRAIPTGDPARAVRVWIEQYVSIAAHPALASRARLFSSMRTVGRRNPQQVIDAQDAVIGPLRAVLTDGKERGVFATARPVGDARAIYLLCAGVLDDALGMDTSDDVVRAAQETAEFVLRALGAG